MPTISRSHRARQRHHHRLQHAEDTINLFLFGDDLTFADLTITATTDGTGSIITVPGEDGQNNGITITLEGVASTDVTADMFEFSNKTPEFSGPDVIPLLGDEGADNLVGTESTNYISGGEGDDTITVTGAVINYAHGGEGDDQITGGAGFMDILVGGEGDDTIDGGTGTNYVHGGEGDDTFVIQAGQTSTTIYDFTDGDDQIDLSNISGVTGFDDLTITADGDDVVINLSGTAPARCGWRTSPSRTWTRTTSCLRRRPTPATACEGSQRCHSAASGGIARRSAAKS